MLWNYQLKICSERCFNYYWLMNNADFGLTLQSLICDYYGLEVNEYAAEQFTSSYNEEYEKELEPLCAHIFEKVGSKPVKLLTYSREMTNGVQTTSPHNFLLDNGKTLSIRTMKTNDMVAPRTVGQAGFPILNEMFGGINGEPLTNQADVRKMVYFHIHELLPIFIDHLFLSDYTLFISKRNLADIKVVSNEEVGNYDFTRDEFTFTRNLDAWTESTTLKYHGVSIAEVQTHLNRSFKFRFKVSAIPEWFHTVKETTETLGITAEAAICDNFGIRKPLSFATRASLPLERKLMPVIKEAFKILPRAVQHTGSTGGTRGKNSKCPYDFILEGNQQLSVKTNKGKMVCPPDVGQPGAEACLHYFKDFFPQDLDMVTNASFKKMVYDHIEEIMPIYVDHLFESEWLLWIYQDGPNYKNRVISKSNIKQFTWQREKFSFTKQELSEWNESNTVKYDGISIGEFQVHQHRVCFKFRFNMPVLLSLLNKE